MEALEVKTNNIYRNKLSKREKQRLMWGYLFISPAILGLVIFWIGPMIYSLIVSFTEWDIITPSKFAGLDNYKKLASDPLVRKSLLVTTYYTVLTVPLSNIVTLFVATLLNTKVKGMSIFRTIIYIPSIVPAVASSALWMFLCNPTFGLLNNILKFFNLPPQNWIFDTKSVIPTLAIMAIWGSGNTVIIYLAGLQGIPRHLFESVEIDGGGVISKFVHITLPMMSPIIFYNLIIGIIGSMQTFTQGYVMTQGGPDNASLFYMLLLYRTAFTNNEMGYACAMAWLLFIIIVILTTINFRFSKSWVFHEGGDKS
jgi:multiple sugar transport system permease protein